MASVSPEARSLVDLLERRAREQGGEPAYAFESDRGERQVLSWRDLWAASARVADVVAGRVPPGERVLLLEPPGLDFLAGFFGLLRARVIAVPLAPPRSARNAARLARVLERAEPRLAWAPPAVEARLSELPGWGRVPFAHASRGPGRFAGDPPDADAVAFLQFTSGSTGDPRGVVLPHRALLHNLEQMRVAFALDQRFVCAGWLPLQHDMGLIGNVLAPLYMGRPCTLMAPETFLMRPARWLRAISETGADVSGGPDFAYRLCAERVKDAELEGVDLSGWRVAFTGAEPVRPSTLERFTERFAAVGFDPQAFFPCYGLAEATLLVASAPPERAPRVQAFDVDALAAGRLEPRADGEGRRLLAHGGPQLDQELAIVSDAGEPLPDGRVGEIWVRGRSVAEGYFGEPPDAESAGTSFGHALAGRGEGWLRTRDFGGVHGGELYVTGRAADLIIVGGRNIYPQDVERVVEASHPDLAEGGAIAFAEEDADGVTVAAEVARVAARRVDPPAVEAAARAALFREEGLRLAALVLLKPGALPRTTSGKPRRGVCRAEHRAGRLAGLEAPRRSS